MSARELPPAHYLLGHTENELRRLDIQDELYRDVTRKGMVAAGIGAGMRVLDLGCGTGAVSLTAAELVGAGGSVVGLDRSEKGLEVARRHASDRGLAHAAFVMGEIDDLDGEPRFDAIVGRFVLMHQADPAAALRSACRVLRPGGRVMMVESYMELLERGPHSFPHSPLYEEIVHWKSAVVRGAGADLEAGGRLRQTFVTAGLPAPTTRLEARLEGGPDSPYYRYVAESVRSMLPEATRIGLGGFSAEDADGLERRLRDEVVAAEGVLTVWPVVVAWSRAPGAHPSGEVLGR